MLVGLDDRLSAPRATLLGLQHVLAMVVGTITPPLLLGHVLGWSAAQISLLVNMALFVSGLTSLIQIRRVGVFGSGLLSVQGTSFAFFGPLLQAGHLGGLPLMLGLSLAAAPMSLVLGPLLPKLKRFFPPVVSGIVVMLIGLSLIPAAMGSLAAGFGSAVPAWQGLAVAAMTMTTLVVLGSTSIPALRTSAIVLALAVGFLISALLGHVTWPRSAAWLMLPRPFHYGLAFRWDLFLPFFFLYFVSALETVGDVTATAHLSGLPIQGADYWARLRGAVMADGLNSLLAGCLNAFPNTTYAQNNGVIQLTRVASRQVGYVMCGFLVVFGLVPWIGEGIAALPAPVFGAAMLLLFGYVASGGMRILYHSTMTHREWMIVAVSLGAGLGVAATPAILDPLPQLLRTIFTSSVVTGGLVALGLNALLPKSLHLG